MGARDDEAVLDVRYGRRDRRSRAGTVAGRLTFADGVLRYDDLGDDSRSFVLPVGGGPGAAAELVHVHSELPLSVGSAPDPAWECLLVLDRAGGVVGQVGGRMPQYARLLEIDTARLRILGRRGGLELRYERDPAVLLRHRYPGARFGGLGLLEVQAACQGVVLLGLGIGLMVFAVVESSWFRVVLALPGLLAAVSGIWFVPTVQRWGHRWLPGRAGRRRRSLGAD